MIFLPAPGFASCMANFSFELIGAVGPVLISEWGLPFGADVGLVKATRCAAGLSEAIQYAPLPARFKVKSTCWPRLPLPVSELINPLVAVPVDVPVTRN